MKVSITVFTLLLIATCSCEPKNKEVTNEQIETGSRTEVLDSVANTREDAVDLDDTAPDSTQSVP